jgi:hypothetical protein
MAHPAMAGLNTDASPPHPLFPAFLELASMLIQLALLIRVQRLSHPGKALFHDLSHLGAGLQKISPM